MWQPVLDEFLKDFVPAASVADSDKQYSTADIVRMLEKHAHVEVDPNEVYSILLDRGFTYGSLGSLEMEWLFKNKVV